MTKYKSLTNQQALNIVNNELIGCFENLPYRPLYAKELRDEALDVLQETVYKLDIYKKAFENLCHTYHVDTKIIGNCVYYSYSTEDELKTSLLKRAEEELKNEA